MFKIKWVTGKKTYLMGILRRKATDSTCVYGIGVLLLMMVWLCLDLVIPFRYLLPALADPGGPWDWDQLPAFPLSICTRESPTWQFPTCRNPYELPEVLAQNGPSEDLLSPRFNSIPKLTLVIQLTDYFPSVVSLTDKSGLSQGGSCCCSWHKTNIAKELGLFSKALWVGMNPYRMK